MKKQIVKIGILALAVTCCNVDANAQKKKKKNKKDNTKTEQKMELKTELDSVSYAVGLSLGTNIKKDFSEGNIDAIMAGLKASMSDSNYLIQPSEMQNIITPYFQAKQAEQQAKQQSEQASQFAGAKEDGVKFLAENKSKEGVVTTASGLQYIVLKEGTGKQPTATSNVTVHYHGTTPDGTIFDSSVDRGQPYTTDLNRVIKGWTEGVALMKEGAKYKFFIPQELAYGANPRPGGAIKPFMPLVFEVELIKINE
jgi:FKBP-type peptidyl-prolyl cis-trans isomerase FklB